MNILRTIPAVLLSLSLAVPALAQSEQADSPVRKHYWTLVSAQLGASLGPAESAVQPQALKNAIVFATLYRDKIRMQDHVRALQGIADSSPSRTNRRLAIAALQAIGNGRAVDYLSRHVSDAEAEAGRNLITSVLNELHQSRSDPDPSFRAS